MFGQRIPCSFDGLSLARLLEAAQGAPRPTARPRSRTRSFLPPAARTRAEQWDSCDDRDASRALTRAPAAPGASGRVRAAAVKTGEKGIPAAKPTANAATAERATAPAAASTAVPAAPPTRLPMTAGRTAADAWTALQPPSGRENAPETSVSAPIRAAVRSEYPAARDRRVTTQLPTRTLKPNDAVCTAARRYRPLSPSTDWPPPVARSGSPLGVERSDGLTTMTASAASATTIAVAKGARHSRAAVEDRHDGECEPGGSEVDPAEDPLAER